MTTAAVTDPANWVKMIAPLLVSQRTKLTRLPPTNAQTPSPFKVGDKVICVTFTQGASVHGGHVCTVKSFAGCYVELVGLPGVFEKIYNCAAVGIDTVALTVPAVDHKEEQRWADMRRANGDNTCQKCSAPLPCAYHT